MSLSGQFRIPCVLLVEDEALICEMVREALIDNGYSVQAAANAVEAMAHLSSPETVDVLFTDINLPGEMDGAQLAEQARGVRPALPVVFASGRWGLLDRLNGFPNSAVLRKPYSLTQACDAVEALIAAPYAGAVPGRVSP